MKKSNEINSFFIAFFATCVVVLLIMLIVEICNL